MGVLDSNRTTTRVMILIVALVLLVLSYRLQAYRFTSLEESYIFLFDWGYIIDTLREPGGVAQLLASFLTQFMRYVWVGPFVTAAIYCGIILCLVKCSCKREPLMVAFAVVPCLCLFLCLESTYYKYQGHVAMLLSACALWIYTRVSRRCATSSRIVVGEVVAVGSYFIAGSSALFVALGMLLYDLTERKPRWYFGIGYIVLAAAVGWLFYESGNTWTLLTAMTPALYYDLNATFNMMIYALSALSLCMVVAAISGREKERTVKREWIWASVVLVVLFVSTVNVYGMVHGASGYDNQKMRYHALRGEWEAISAMPYDGSGTPFTSYRFLALAKKGQLVERMWEYKPFIDYFMKNQPLVKKADQQMMSDMYYQCDYMAAARRAAFDTDIVTPGAFNPEETGKLIDIQLAYGNYRVAEKLISQLEKTLFYSSWARDRRRFLDNDALVEADLELGPKRMAIPADNNYMSPWGLQRELQYVVDSNPDQLVARQFLEAFMNLTFQK